MTLQALDSDAVLLEETYYSIGGGFIRREGEDVTFLTFLARGAIVMPPALLLALAGLLVR